MNLKLISFISVFIISIAHYSLAMNNVSKIKSHKWVYYEMTENTSQIACTKIKKTGAIFCIKTESEDSVFSIMNEKTYTELKKQYESQKKSNDKKI